MTVAAFYSTMLFNVEHVHHPRFQKVTRSLNSQRYQAQTTCCRPEDFNFQQYMKLDCLTQETVHGHLSARDSALWEPPLCSKVEFFTRSLLFRFYMCVEILRSEASRQLLRSMSVHMLYHSHHMRQPEQNRLVKRSATVHHNYADDICKARSYCESDFTYVSSIFSTTIFSTRWCGFECIWRVLVVSTHFAFTFSGHWHCYEKKRSGQRFASSSGTVFLAHHYNEDHIQLAVYMACKVACFRHKHFSYMFRFHRGYFTFSKIIFLDRQEFMEEVCQSTVL